jgi:MYXO-CTERM domain-containing protein
MGVMMKMKTVTAVLGAAVGVSLVSVGSVLAQTTLTPSVLKVNEPGTTVDLARVQNGRLRRTDSAQTNEQATVAVAGDGVHGLYCHMRSGPINGALPPHRTQVACSPFQLVAGAGGVVNAEKLPGERFVTNNDGDEYRNGHKPSVVACNGGKNFCLMYNYQPDGDGNTKRWMKVLGLNGEDVPMTDGNGNSQSQVLIMAKNNDDCDMSQSGEGPCDTATDVPGATHLACYAGCNGNGRDDGWLNDVTVTFANNASGAATSAQVKKNFDVSINPQEERGRGRCSVSSADPNTAICTYTAGNNQPQRDGTWIAAVDISPNGPQGANVQSRLLWRKLVEGRKDIPGGGRTYSMRINSSRIVELGADGKLVKTDNLVIYTGDLQGNNNGNRKGGRYLDQRLGVAQATRAGLTWVIPMTSARDLLLGIDGTHTTFTAGLLQDGTKGAAVPVVSILQGSQNGGGVAPADLKVLGIDLTAKAFVQYGTHSAGASSDRHLYSNYLGNNPGNQGRNFTGSEFLPNPFHAPGSGQAPFLLLHALSGKDSSQVAQPQIKTTTYLSIVPMKLGGQGNGAGPAQNASGGGQNADVAAAATDASGAVTTPQADSSGCSSSGQSTSPAGALLMALAAVCASFVARRRRA